jgi:pimeloyl-ACP methyl ester carboxylesterase
VFDGAHLRVQLWDQGTPGVVVSFCSYRRGRDGFDPPQPMALAGVLGLSVLRVETACNDWFLNPDLSDAMAAAAWAVRDNAQVATIGFSMGGYGALRFAAAVGARRVVAVSTQASPIPERAPFETRWRPERKALPPFLDDLSALAGSRAEIVLVYDPLDRNDRAHVGLLRDVPGVMPVAMPLGGHPATAVLREGGLWNAFTRSVVLGPSDRPGWKAMHRQAREASDGYAARLTERLRLRASRSSGPAAGDARH